jgi:hypothetical protein
LDGRLEGLLNTLGVDYIEDDRLEDLEGTIHCIALWDDQLARAEGSEDKKRTERGGGAGWVRKKEAYISDSRRIIKREDLSSSLLIRTSCIIMNLHIELFLIIFILPELKGECPSCGGNAITVPHGDPVQVKESLEVEDVRVMRNEQQELCVGGLKRAHAFDRLPSDELLHGAEDIGELLRAVGLSIPTKKRKGHETNQTTGPVEI